MDNLSPVNLKAIISMHSPEWAGLKKWALREKELLVQKLIKAETHDKSNELRGAIKFIDQLLAVEKDAAIAASRQGH